MEKLLLTLGVLVTLSACAVTERFGRSAPMPDSSVIVTDQPGPEVLRPRARTIAGPGVDSATVIAPPAPASDGFLGETLAGLGSPGEAGLWLRTGLVRDTRRGRIVAPDGRSLTLELRPSATAASAGSQISLMAMQSLGLPLGALATLRVFVE